MRVDEFDFDLPEDRIALRPVDPRDRARMLVIGPGPQMRDHCVRELPNFLRAGDALVFNDTKVIPAQLEGFRLREGHRALIGITLHLREGPARWRAFARGAKKIKQGDELRFPHPDSRAGFPDLTAVVSDIGTQGEIALKFELSGSSMEDLLSQYGVTPLPPYIAQRRAEDERDRHDYQTFFARKEGAVAAPTAGLHFTPSLMTALKAAQISTHFLTLHVGAGTFLPVKSETTEDHVMHAEWGRVDETTASALNSVRSRGGRIACVGTTSLRLLESCVNDYGRFVPWEGTTDIFITPGFRFRAADILVTNFHLPRSTLFMLVSAFAGLETMQRAYSHAIAQGYRFYSYGDACLIYRVT